MCALINKVGLINILVIMSIIRECTIVIVVLRGVLVNAVSTVTITVTTLMISVSILTTVAGMLTIMR